MGADIPAEHLNGSFAWCDQSNLRKITYRVPAAKVTPSQRWKVIPKDVIL